MNDSTREISPLRQRMLEDMRLRKLAPQTQVGYVRAVRRLAGYLRRPPDTATVEATQLSAAPGRSWHFADHPQRDHHRIEVLLRRHAGSCRVDGEDETGVCAADLAGRFESRGSQFADRGAVKERNYTYDSGGAPSTKSGSCNLAHVPRSGREIERCNDIKIKYLEALGVRNDPNLEPILCRRPASHRAQTMRAPR